MTEHRYDGRVAVITGSGRGLGRTYALLLASRGARIVVNDNGSTMEGDNSDAGPAEEVVREIKAQGGDAVAITDSVATPEGGKAIVEAALDNFGKIDILIHSAGNVRADPIEELSLEDFTAVLDVHLMGAFHVVKRAFPVMAKANYGRIVLTSSIGGLYGRSGILPYGTAKAGIIGINNVVALEGAAKGITSNIILPGAMTRLAARLDTENFPPSDPELVAPVVAWLAHETCSITGEMLVSMAGRVARALIAETEGIYRPAWTIEDVAENLSAIRDSEKLWTIPPVPSGFFDHMGRSFAMVREANANASAVKSTGPK